MKYTIKSLTQFIDHTNLKADATEKDMELLCNEAKEYNFKMVAINQVQTEICSKELKGSHVGIGAAISFPLGQTSIESKVFETKDAIENGATEIDYVINISKVKENNFGYIQNEMEKIVNFCREKNVTSKVILETHYLEKKEIIKICEIAKTVKPDFVKTSTGFAEGGATVEDVQLMKKTVGNTVKVKAAGGIRSLQDFKDMIISGAERIGTSSGIKIIEEVKKKLEESNTDYIEF